MNTAFSKILVANRGEIACRVIASAQAAGFGSVAVYSDADADARHVHMADQAVGIGAAPVSESYLVADKIIDAAKRAGADAIHPGYGFLSENAEFAEACTAAGIVFIGPSAQAISLMGNKAAAKRRMIEANVPCVPGYEGEAQDDATLIRQAVTVGFPLMVKAAAGGGGRGMRLVNNESELPGALAAARSEALNAFGSDELILERAIINARHVEIQVLGDAYGKVVHLGERDCSVQRRHQKVIEEAPSPAVDEELRAAMGAAAVKATAAIDYQGVGTVEFLVAADGAFYFLEMNTRLQVEHPVTEMITGIDLVRAQFDVAAGRPLGFDQDDISLTGHAIEARLYAEDPSQEFLPQTGTVLAWDPATADDVRVDHGLTPGAEISPYYDPMVAKVVAHGRDREEARRRLVMALQNTTVLGLTTNKEFLATILDHPVFAAGHADTGFIATHLPPSSLVPKAAPLRAVALAAALLIDNDGKHQPDGLSGWRSTGTGGTPLSLEINSDIVTVSVAGAGGQYRVIAGGDALDISLIECAKDRVRFMADGIQEQARFVIHETMVHLDYGGRGYQFMDVTLAPAESAESGADGILRSPMNGTVLKVNVAVGEAVSRGQSLLVVEAMKMEHQILAPVDGVVETVSVEPGQQVGSHAIVATLAASEDKA